MDTAAIDTYKGVALGVEAAWPASHSIVVQKRSWLAPLLEYLPYDQSVKSLPSIPNTA
jgi:hypothetical protein